MNLVEALTQVANITTTANGALAYKSTLNANLDFYGCSGNIGIKEEILLDKFDAAFTEDEDLAIRNLLNMRDIRGGKGVRDNSRKVLKHLLENIKPTKELDLSLLLARFVDVGRWDDLLFVYGENEQLDKVIEHFFIQGLASENPTLVAKWTPLNQKDSKSKKFMSALRAKLKLSPKQMRKYIVEKRNIVETKMCENLWSDIDYKSVPSQAMRIYKKSFGRNDEVRFEEYIDSVQKGETKINASTLYPHEVLGRSHITPDNVAEVQWKALPNYIKEGVGILPMVDVSGSMQVKSYGEYMCMDISVALGMYLAEKNTTHFANSFITFHSNPEFVKFKEGDSLAKRKSTTLRASWGGTTNLNKAFNLILDAVKEHGLNQEDLPDYLVVLSDMQFDPQNGRDKPISVITKGKFEELGLVCPKLIWWNLSTSGSNTPVTFDQEGNALVSGFSPSVMTALLADDLETYTPENVMLKDLMQDKYSVFK